MDSINTREKLVTIEKEYRCNQITIEETTYTLSNNDTLDNLISHMNNIEGIDSYKSGVIIFIESKGIEPLQNIVLNINNMSITMHSIVLNHLMIRTHSNYIEANIKIGSYKLVYVSTLNDNILIMMV